MNRSKGAKAIMELAKQKGISVQEVRKEIQIAIDMGRANTDADVQASWAEMASKGVNPTPEEVISYIAKRVKKII